MITVEMNFLCDGINREDCYEDSCYTTEPGDMDLGAHIKEAIDNGWKITLDAKGDLHCLCPDCQHSAKVIAESPISPFKPKKQ
jgi:hypothetical protein